MRGKLYTPGYFEVYVGPMKSGKTLELAHRLDKFNYQTHASYALFKPSLDDRFEGGVTKTRYRDIPLEATLLPHNNPEIILSQELPLVVAFDEMQFYSPGIVNVVRELMDTNHHIIGTGLDLDFRGEPFGQMGSMLALANEVYKLTGVCESCGVEGTRTQRLINGLPAHYDEPVVSIEGKKQKESYECRCLDCHDVPKD